MFFASKRPLVAIDIGSYSIKLLELKPTGDGYELVNMGMTLLPPDSMIDGEVENSEAVVDSLKKLVQSEKLLNKNIVMSVSGQSVIIKKISVPQMSKEELAEMIREEAEQYIPFDIDEVNLDFQEVKPVFGEGEEPEESPEQGDESGEIQMDVIIVAARKDTIAVFEEIIKEVGLRMRVLDLDVFALENTFELNYPPELDETIAIVNIGGTMTNVNILEKGITAFTRDIPIGGNTISEIIQKKLSVGFSEAENLKLGNMFDEYTNEDIIPHVIEGIEEICFDLRKTFELYEKTSDYKISKLFICGGSVLLEGIDAVISNELGIKVEFLKSFKRIKVNDKKFDPTYVKEMESVMALPVGLALRRLEEE